ncbi:MAG: endolytic transglycosylase MltG [Anaerolineales bacterium]|nr:endolytic transglycosylase MltG [Anaerolineales bacterium]
MVRAFVKLAIVLLALTVVGGAIAYGYRLAFPPQPQQTTAINVPQIDFGQCGAPGDSGLDPTDLAYAFQLDQYKDLLDKPASSDKGEVNFTVEEGELPMDVTARLEKEGLIENADAFLLLLKCRHAAERIQAGDHIMRRNMTMDEVILSLQRGTTRGVAITIRPGWRAEQIADYLATVNLPQFDKDEFLKIVREGDSGFAFLQDRPRDGSPGLEGYLFPETYQVLQGITAPQLVNRLLSEFDQRVTSDMRAKATNQGLTLQEAITLASIVERETVKPEEAPLIASVYLNRIKAKTYLNADPTVQYAIGFVPETKQWWKTPVTLAEYQKVDSPYNTYLNPGLPPGPIAAPSMNSIQAVLEPAQTDYFYFLATGDGGHVFARTLEEQNANLSKYGYEPAPTPQ